MACTALLLNNNNNNSNVFTVYGVNGYAGILKIISWSVSRALRGYRLFLCKAWHPFGHSTREIEKSWELLDNDCEEVVELTLLLTLMLSERILHQQSRLPSSIKKVTTIYPYEWRPWLCNQRMENTLTLVPNSNSLWWNWMEAGSWESVKEQKIKNTEFKFTATRQKSLGDRKQTY